MDLTQPIMCQARGVYYPLGLNCIVVCTQSNDYRTLLVCQILNPFDTDALEEGVCTADLTLLSQLEQGVYLSTTGKGKPGKVREK